MGGSYYDRILISSSNQDNNNFNNPVGVQSTLHPNLNPTNWSGELNKIKTFSRSPIVFGLDVTGSMKEWAKIIYEKLPMFYGQLIQQKYLEDPSISFSAIGDSDWSLAPLQITPFSQGVEIDDQIKKLFLEGGGGGNGKESYELLAYFYLNQVDLKNSQFPFLFITGDEIFFETLTPKAAEKVLNIKLESEINSFDLFRELCKKYNIFHVRKSYGDPKTEKEMTKKWAEAIGKERILDINDPKACIDVILGAIALTSGSRNLEGYVEDMKKRGQTKERIKEVTRALILYSSRIQTGKIEPIINQYMSKNFVDEFGNYIEEEIEEPDKQETLNLLNDFKKTFVFPSLTEEDEEKREKIKKIMKDFPPELFCPITGEVFINPVLTEDGQTYEKSAIDQWFKLGHMKSPLSGVRLNSKELIQNANIKQLILFYKDN